MIRILSVCSTALTLACLAGAQSTWIHVSGGDATSWAMVRVAPGQVAHIGDLAGVHIGDVTKDELVVVRGGKPYTFTDPKMLSEVESIESTLNKPRENRLKERGAVREVRNEQRSLDRERRNLEREKVLLQRNSARNSGSGSADKEKEIDRKIDALGPKTKELARKMDEANKRADEATKVLDAARAECERKLEKFFDTAIGHGEGKR